MNLPRVFAVVLNFNRPEDTAECLRSLLGSDYPNLQVIFVDNASSDDSWKRVSAEFPELFKIRNPENWGYAEGNNVGIRAALERGAEYVLVINNDAIVEKDAIRKLVDAGAANPLAAILAPKICYYDRPEIINSLGTEMDWFRLRPKLGKCGTKNDGSKEAFQARIIPGSALLLRRRLFDEVGYFEPRFFLIHEDADLCLRNLEQGYQNVVVADAIVYHKLSKTLSAYPFLTQYYSIRNFLYLAEWRAGFGRRALAYFGLLLLTAKKLFAMPFLKGVRRRETAGFFAGARDYLLRRTGPYAGRIE
jgi:hypothetical protein